VRVAAAISALYSGLDFSCSATKAAKSRSGMGTAKAKADLVDE
jgi:hypothetical protein